MLERVLDMGTGIYILWGIGVFGLLLKMIASTYLRGMIKASENMSTTKRTSLRIMRQKYENGRNLGINNGSGAAFAEKNIRGLRLIAMPLEFWRRSGQFLTCVTCIVMAGGFLYYDVTWRGSPEMVTFIANGIIVCAFLLALENIFLINNKVEMLKANVRDYLENLTPARAEKNRQAVGVKKKMPDKTVVTQADKLTDKMARMETAATESAAKSGSSDGKVSAPSVYDERASDALNNFLQEYFS